MKVSTIIATLVLSGMVIVSPHVFAQQPVQRDYPYVFQIAIKSDNRLWINVKGNYQNVHGCTPWFAASDVTLSDDRARAWLQIALASYLSKTRVYVTTLGCISAPDGGPQYPKIIDLEIEMTPAPTP